MWCQQYDLFILYSFKGFFPQKTFFKSSPFGNGNAPRGLFLKIYWVRRVAGLGDLTGGEFLPFQTAVLFGSLESHPTHQEVMETLEGQALAVQDLGSVTVDWYSETERFDVDFFRRNQKYERIQTVSR